MSDVDHIDPRDTAKIYAFVRDIENGTPAKAVRLELAPEIALAEFVKAINAAGLVLSTIAEGRQLIHRAPKEAA